MQDDLLLVKNEKAAEETSSRLQVSFTATLAPEAPVSLMHQLHELRHKLLQRYVDGISHLVETTRSEAGLSAQPALDLS